MKQWILFAILVFFAVSCKKNDDTSNGGNGTNGGTKLMQLPEEVPGDSITISSFPLAVGNTWTYHIKSQVYALNDTEDVKEYDVTISVAADTLINGFHVYRMAMTGPAAGELFLSDEINEQFPSYYIQTNSGLYYLPDINPVDTPRVNTALMILKYPASPWSYQYTNGYMPQKQTAGFVKIATPVKTFDCLKVSVVSHAGRYKGVQQYFSEKGLVQQTMSFQYDDINRQRTIYNLKLMMLKSVNF